MNELDEFEEYLIKTIEIIQADARKRCEPYVKELVRIRSLKPVNVMVEISNEEAYGAMVYRGLREMVYRGLREKEQKD